MYQTTSLFSEAMQKLWSTFLQLRLESEIKCQDVSSETTYAVYLVYKLPEDQSTFEAPLVVKERHLCDHPGWYIYLAGPHTPVIRPKLNENTQNPVARPSKLNVVPQQRSDGWMEVKVSKLLPKRFLCILGYSILVKKILMGLWYKASYWLIWCKALRL